MPQLFSLPVLSSGSGREVAVPQGILPLTEGGKSCGTGCDSGGTHPQPKSDRRETRRQIEIPFARRRLNLDAIPSSGTAISSLDMDLTVECNLRCTYCFKEKWTEHMEEQVAFDTMVWFLHASGTMDDLNVAFMGGEPLLRFKLIKKLVPFAKRRAAQCGKKIHFGMTTNGTLVTDEVVRFWRQWGLGFHTSIDGTPEVQDRNRPTTGGKGSSRLVEQSSRRILAYRPNTTARSTVVAESAGAITASYKYFRSLGYTDIAFVPGGLPYWDGASLGVYEDQFRQLADLVMDDLRAGNPVNVKGFDDYAKSRAAESRPRHACGAGRGMVLIDIHGDIWPCHRWNKAEEAGWRIGSIYEQFDEAVRAPLDTPSFSDLLENDCHLCPAQKSCGGGCPAENLEDTGKVHRRHLNACAITRIWHRVGERVYETMMAEANPTYREVYCSANGAASEGGDPYA
jgi:uncharacterized protein